MSSTSDVRQPQKTDRTETRSDQSADDRRPDGRPDAREATPSGKANRNTQGGAPRRDDLTRDERPGGALEMPRSSRARDLRDEANDQRDSNDLGSGTST